jgi:hypothetical protein
MVVIIKCHYYLNFLSRKCVSILLVFIGKFVERVV